MYRQEGPGFDSQGRLRAFLCGVWVAVLWFCPTAPKHACLRQLVGLNWATQWICGLYCCLIARRSWVRLLVSGVCMFFQGGCRFCLVLSKLLDLCFFLFLLFFVVFGDGYSWKMLPYPSWDEEVFSWLLCWCKDGFMRMWWRDVLKFPNNSKDQKSGGQFLTLERWRQIP